MSTQTVAANHTEQSVTLEQSFERVTASSSLTTESWIREVRERAHNRTTAMGLPTPRDEHWRYTNLRPLRRQAFTPSALMESDSDIGRHGETLARLKERHSDANFVVLIDGRLHSLEMQSGSGNGWQCRTLQQAADAAAKDASAKDVPKWYRPLPETQQHYFTELNTAHLGEGVLLELSTGRSDVATVIAHLATGTQPHAGHTQTHIHCAEDAEGTVIEYFMDDTVDAPYLNNAITSIELGRGATLTHTQLQAQSALAYFIATISVQQATHSDYRSHIVSLGSKLARHDVNVVFNGPYARCALEGLIIGRSNQHTDIHTWVDHAVPDCVSAQNVRCVLDGHSRGIFNGRVDVRQNAQRTDATQANDNLLLSDNAEVDTKPQLEILADDVKCAHGATVGQLDEQAIFYLRTRGIDSSEAKAMLTAGFVARVVDTITHPGAREIVADSVSDALGGSNAGRFNAER